MSLTNKTIANTYRDILYVENNNTGIGGINKNVKTGNGANAALKLSKDSTTTKPTTAETTSAFRVQAYEGATLLQVDSTNTEVKALGQYVNTGVHQFMYSAVNAHPDTDDTWSALDAIGGGRFRGGNIELGTGSSPATSYDVSGGNQADDLVQSIWYVPFNISIDAVKVWFGQDDATGDIVKFSVMSYDISTANDATGGDLSAGVENCVSPSTISGAGYEQAYYQSLTVNTANVDAGKAIVACVHQATTASDLTVNMQLVYHLRST
jgi:hypothetical protein